MSEPEAIATGFNKTAGEEIPAKPPSRKGEMSEPRATAAGFFLLLTNTTTIDLTTTNAPNFNYTWFDSDFRLAGSNQMDRVPISTRNLPQMNVDL